MLTGGEVVGLTVGAGVSPLTVGEPWWPVPGMSSAVGGCSCSTAGACPMHGGALPGACDIPLPHEFQPLPAVTHLHLNGCTCAFCAWARPVVLSLLTDADVERIADRVVEKLRASRAPVDDLGDFSRSG